MSRTTIERNPFISTADPVAEEARGRDALSARPETDPVLLGEQLEAVGPQVPQRAGESGGGGPVGSQRPAGGPIQVLGLVGGCGASTIAALIGEDLAVDAGRWEAGDLIGGTCLVVSSTRAAGLAAAAEFGRRWHEGAFSSAHVLGLVLVDDGPKIPPALRKRAQHVTGVLPRLWRIGWSEPLRLVEHPDGVSLSWRTRLTVSSIRRRYSSLASSPTANTSMKTSTVSERD